MKDAIERQLVSDVPLCCFLSGGLDSSIISKIASDKYREKGEILSTYSVTYTDNEKYFTKSRFQPNSDEVYIRLMRDFIGSDHNVVTLDNEKLAKALFESTLARDLPGMADIDSSLLLFAREIKKNFTVGVSGECADELFAGYPWYHDREALYGNSFPWATSTGVRKRLFRSDLTQDIDEYIKTRYDDTVSLAGRVDGESVEDKKMREMFLLNFYWFMQTLLDRKDRMTMFCGLEVRVPFCDHNIVEYAYNMP